MALRCQASVSGGISWFAFRMEDDPEAAKMLLSVMSTAKVAGRTLFVGFESTDTTGDAWGCEAANCRIIKKLEML